MGEGLCQVCLEGNDLGLVRDIVVCLLPLQWRYKKQVCSYVSPKQVKNIIQTGGYSLGKLAVFGVICLNSIYTNISWKTLQKNVFQFRHLKNKIHTTAMK